MIHPIPAGTRDVLPDEMRELRALSNRLHETFERAGYGEVWTPAIEYEEVLRRGDERAAGAGFRLFDDRGNLLALRSDMTIPIARVVSSRDAEVIALTIRALDEAGLRRHRVGVGDGNLYRDLLSTLEVPDEERRGLLE